MSYDENQPTIESGKNLISKVLHSQILHSNNDLIVLLDSIMSSNYELRKLSREYLKLHFLVKDMYFGEKIISKATLPKIRLERELYLFSRNFVLSIH